MRIPDFFLVGAPKSATTAMHHYLRQHPQLFMPAMKELHYFGSDLAGLPGLLTAEQYGALFAAAPEGTRVGQTSIWALYSERAAQEIQEANPAARIVVMLRDPVEMMYALHNEFVANGIEDIGNFARALDAEADRRLGKRLPLDGRYPARIYLHREVASYCRQVQRYISTFGSQRVHVILFDDLCQDPGKTYRRLLEFLGVDPSFRPEMPIIHPNRRVAIPALLRWMDQPPALVMALTRLLVPSASLRARLAGALRGWNKREAPRTPMSPTLRARLQREFAPEIERLSLLLGRDLRQWGAQSVAAHRRAA